jgi:hypothetical protein
MDSQKEIIQNLKKQLEVHRYNIIHTEQLLEIEIDKLQELCEGNGGHQYVEHQCRRGFNYVCKRCYHRTFIRQDK